MVSMSNRAKKFTQIKELKEIYGDEIVRVKEEYTLRLLVLTDKGWKKASVLILIPEKYPRNDISIQFSGQKFRHENISAGGYYMNPFVKQGQGNLTIVEKIREMMKEFEEAPLIYSNSDPLSTDATLEEKVNIFESKVLKLKEEITKLKEEKNTAAGKIYTLKDEILRLTSNIHTLDDLNIDLQEELDAQKDAMIEVLKEHKEKEKEQNVRMKVQFNLLTELLIKKVPDYDMAEINKFMVPSHIYRNTHEFDQCVAFHEEIETGQMVALKGFHIDHELQRRHVIKEFKNMLKCIESPYVVTPYQLAWNDNSMAILMEHGGKSLNKFWEYWEADFNEGIIIFYKLAMGLKLIHNENIYHGDIKPQNILINGRAKGENVKFTDFGAAVSFEISGIHLTKSAKAYSLRAFTMGYLAPEIAYFVEKKQRMRGDIKHDKLDIYSLTLTIYCLMTRKLITNKEVKLKNAASPNAYEEFLNYVEDSINMQYLTEGNIEQTKLYDFQGLLRDCLDFNPRMRPSLDEIIDRLYCLQDLCLEDLQ